jgi:DNA polymerase I - 3''-5'' exonuclease and polymerase domains
MALLIDIETYSDIDLIKCGVYAYTNSPNFEILLFAYSIDEGPVQIVDLASGEPLPDAIISLILDPTITKTAFNANFERTCISKYLNTILTVDGWKCIAVQAAMLALPLSLDGVGKVLGLDQQKMQEGKELIKYFSVPCKAIKVNGGRNRNLPADAPDKWDTFKKYCIRDVEVEMDIGRKLCQFPIPERELDYYSLDQEINDRGVLVDMKFVEQAILCDKLQTQVSTQKAYELTGLDNPNSVAQLKVWLASNGLEVDSLSKKVVSDLVKEADGEVEKLLKLRLLMAKTSIKKYEAIVRCVCSDGRVRGLFQFAGACRTSRWAGRLVQLQNLPQNHIEDLSLAKELVKNERFEDIELFYESTPNILSELIRTAFVPKKGSRFIVSDFSAIEARVIAWLSGEQWRMEVFKTHGRIYEASASQMFKVPINEIKKGTILRQKGKIAELALGYGGACGALAAMGALDMGLKEEELQPLVTAWRNANVNITAFWWDVDSAALNAVKNRTRVVLRNLTFEYRSGILFIKLPSGRHLSYIKPRIEVNRFGREGLTYEGLGENKKWQRIETYGPKLVENIVQATSRDLLAEAMLRVTKAGYPIVMHVHDEIIAEVETEKGSVDEMSSIMAEEVPWAKGLPLRADGYECSFYQKD